MFMVTIYPLYSSLAARLITYALSSLKLIVGLFGKLPFRSLRGAGAPFSLAYFGYAAGFSDVKLHRVSKKLGR